MADHKPLDDRLALRLNAKDKRAFVRKCDKSNRQYQDLLREMIVAFNEDRLRIVKPDQLGDLYVTGK